MPAKAPPPPTLGPLSARTKTVLWSIREQSISWSYLTPMPYVSGQYANNGMGMLLSDGEGGGLPIRKREMNVIFFSAGLAYSFSSRAPMAEVCVSMFLAGGDFEVSEPLVMCLNPLQHPFFSIGFPNSFRSSSPVPLYSKAGERDKV